MCEKFDANYQYLLCTYQFLKKFYALFQTFNLIGQESFKRKNNLFQFIFGRDKKALLELYNALNDTNYTNVNDLEIVTIEGAIYLTMKNDLAFILADTLNMYEHQSSLNKNMPVRMFDMIPLK